MTDQDGSKPADYIVGYGRPPKATQFTAGKSGNPRGRPKGSRPVGAVLRDIIRQKVPVTEGAKTRRIPVLEVMLRRLANAAMKGDQKAIRLLLSLVDHYAESPETAIQFRELLAEDAEILGQYLRESVSSAPPPPSTEASDDAV